MTWNDIPKQVWVLYISSWCAICACCVLECGNGRMVFLYMFVGKHALARWFHPRSLVANNLFRVAVLPSRKSHQQNCHIYPVYHKIHVCHIYLCLFLVGLQPKHDPNVMTVGANVTGCYSKKTLWLEQETKTKNTTPIAVEKKSEEIQGWWHIIEVISELLHIVFCVFLLQGNGRHWTFLILKYVSNGPKPPPPPAATKLSVSYSCFVNAANAHRKRIAVKFTNPNGMDFLMARGSTRPKDMVKLHMLFSSGKFSCKLYHSTCMFSSVKCVICLPGSWKKYKPWEFFEKWIFEGPHSRVDLEMFFHPSSESLRRDACSWTSKLVLLIKNTFSTWLDVKGSRNLSPKNFGETFID